MTVAGKRKTVEAGGAERRPARAVFALAALGVVFGDIGTSPLYAFKQCFGQGHGIAPTPAHIVGILSLICWALIGVVSIKYATFVLRADHEGEGGDLALLALLHPTSRVGIPAALSGIAMLVLFGSGMLYGDGVITPAISVLSAVEGLGVATKSAQPFVVPVSVAILLTLFAVQRRGTGGIGKVFGPIMCAWFFSIALAGAVSVARHPAVLEAVNPLHALAFLTHNRWAGVRVLGAVVLCVSGVEALYADLGHFGRGPIRMAWYVVVFPALLLNYFGQGALTLQDHSALENPFYALFPGWMLYLEVALATLATVIASQALISGAFSVTQQAVQLGYAPRLKIIHTSQRYAGRIYLPLVNVLLAVTCIALVLSFRSSDRLGAAYGLAVTVTMLCTSIAYFAVARKKWHWPLWRAAAVVGFFLLFDVSFLVGNIPKIIAGGWIPLVIALTVFTLFTTWIEGRRRLAKSLAARSVSVADFLREAIGNRFEERNRAAGSAVFLTAHPEGIPYVLRNQWLQNRLLHDYIVLLTIVHERIPAVDPSERVSIERLAAGFVRVKARYGFTESPTVGDIRDCCTERGLSHALDTATYFLARPKLVPARGRDALPGWKRALYAYLMRNARPLTDSLGLPVERTVEFGVEVFV